MSLNVLIVYYLIFFVYFKKIKKLDIVNFTEFIYLTVILINIIFKF